MPISRISSAGLPAAATMPIGIGRLHAVDDEDVARALDVLEMRRAVAEGGVDVVDVAFGGSVMCESAEMIGWVVLTSISLQMARRGRLDLVVMASMSTLGSISHW